ncbi:putative ras-like small GTPase [Leptomonas pyrrhocoris]|uniref:Putative ras-like small GTPase n=1 Tax=Leptomonas pyrrhocoris TaxID=157538 RepID=A0A0N0DVB1_LEPPY|nr:putative ras-like small GTPase [Leptomonas pyrrhocoris]KPA80112.1 putative ras-like small GTPase [Leptomonas pyrrhocoris]|eukprot:XP_015658551.1 putative ras-like small GTPase [Leptomonas pyrrhocoris]
MTGGMPLPPPHSASAKSHLPEIRAVVLGDGCVGKTSLLRQYLDHEGLSSSSEYEPTLLDSYTQIEYCGRQPYRVYFTDCSSAPEFSEHRAAYLAKCDVVILVFSALHRKTLLNLRTWMKEVVKARTSTGPVRFASTAGDFSEVPIFVVGTHHAEKHAAAAQKSVPLSEAESITMECLHLAGYFVNEEDAESEEGLHLQRAAMLKKEGKLSKKKQSPYGFHNFFANLFRSGAVDYNDDDDDRRGKPCKSKSSDKAAKKSKKENEAKDAHRSSSHSRTVSQLHTPCASSAEKPPRLAEPTSEGVTPSDGSPLLALPPGASTYLPLYMLSNADGEAVSTAVRASLALHLWLKQPDDSDEVTPLTSPCARNSAVLVLDNPISTVGSGQTRSTPPAESAGLPPQHGRTVSVVSHTSHMSERSAAASFIPSMHALYGSVASLGAFETSFRHSRAASSGPLTEGSSPSGTGQPAQVLVAVGESTPQTASSPGLEGRTTTEPYPNFSLNGLRNKKGPLKKPVWCSPTVISPTRAEELNAGATPNIESVPPGRLPASLEAPQKDVTPLQDGQLVHANASIHVSSLPNPRQATAPNTATKIGITERACEVPPSIPTDDYSALSGNAGSSSVHPLPTWATADTPVPRGSRGKADTTGDLPDRVWRDVDAEGHVDAATDARDTACTADSVVKKLALEREAKSLAASPTTAPQKPPVKSAGASPANNSLRQSPAASEPIAMSRHRRTSSESSISTLCSPSASPLSGELTHTHSRAPSLASPSQPQGVSRSQTCPPLREEEELAKSGSMVPLNGPSRAGTKRDAQQKQSTKQCTTDGCTVM